MRVMWMSNAPWAGTGYGVQTRLMLKGLQRVGFDIDCFAIYGLHGGCIRYDGYKVWPNSDLQQWGNDVIRTHLHEAKSDVLVSLLDLFVLDSRIYRDLPVPWVAWVPIDCEEIGHPTTERLQFVNYPIAMSNFGAEQLAAAGTKPYDTIYHAVDTEVFKPLEDPHEKAEVRKTLGIDPDCYLVGMVMANKGDRKKYPLQFQAVNRWFEVMRDKDPNFRGRVFIHTDPTTTMGGWDMKDLARMSGLKGQTFCTNQYAATVVPVEAETLAKMYQAMDVLMNVSAGEGFGVPIIEAQACGVPVITGNWTAMPELTHNGYTIDASFRDLAHHYGWQYLPSIEDMVYRLDCVYRMGSQAKNAQGRAWVAQNCSVPVITQQWQDLLLRIEEERASLPPLWKPGELQDV